MDIVIEPTEYIGSVIEISYEEVEMSSKGNEHFISFPWISFWKRVNNKDWLSFTLVESLFGINVFVNIEECGFFPGIHYSTIK